MLYNKALYSFDVILGSLTQAIRNFAKCLESWLSSAMVGCPDEVVKVKVSLTLFSFKPI